LHLTLRLFDSRVEILNGDLSNMLKISLVTL